MLLAIFFQGFAIGAPIAFIFFVTYTFFVNRFLKNDEEKKHMAEVIRNGLIIGGCFGCVYGLISIFYQSL